MENLVWGIIFIMEVMKYILGEKIFFKRTIERKWGGTIVFLVYMLIIWLVPTSKEEVQYIVMYAMAIITVYIMIQQKKAKDFVHILILLIELSCIDGVVEIFIRAILKRIECTNLLYEYQILLNNSIVLILFCVAYIYIKQKKVMRRKIKIEYIWIIILCMMVNILLTAAGLYVAKEYVRNDLFDSFFTITNICSYISVGLMIFFMIYIKNTNQKMQQLLITEKQLKEAQEHYYRSLLKKEEETRKSRHDWNNHLICLAELAKKENADNTKQYIDALMKQNAYLKDRQYDVGNDILNAILCYHLSELDDDISVRIAGKCRNDINIAAVDLCVIVSNLVQNAVEYLKGNNIESKELTVSIEEGNVYKRISVVNSVDPNMSERNLKTTTKSDKRNHGIGLRNVKETIEKNGGKLEINIQEGMFKADVIWN